MPTRTSFHIVELLIQHEHWSAATPIVIKTLSYKDDGIGGRR